MALHDYRRMVEVGDVDPIGVQPFAAVELTANTAQPIRLEVSFGGLGVALALDEGEADAVIAALLGALEVLHPDTPQGDV